MSTKPKTSADTPSWYGEGLSFECLPDCGACCTNHDEYAYVYLDGDDLPLLAAHLGMAIPEFTRRYTDRDEEWTILKMDEPACPFLDEERCSVYEARPTQCRTFPFWQENLKTPAAWDRLRNFCPGIGRGPVHSLRTIRGHLALRSVDEEG